MPPAASTRSHPRSKAVDVVVRRNRPTPSAVYPVLWQFAAKRQAIYERRIAGEPAPWTADPILLAYKFTNAFRAADRVSQYLIRLAYADDDAQDDDLFLRILLFKIFNNVATWEHLVRTVGAPSARSFDVGKYSRALASMKSSGRAIYSGAYIMPSGGAGSKHEMHLGLVAELLRQGMPAKAAATRSLKSLYELLRSIPTFGPFLAFQYAIDLNYSTLVDHSEGSFVVAGPGALDGLSKCFSSLGDYTPEDTIQWLADEQDAEFERLDLAFNGLWGRKLQPIDVQNLFCEVSKYTRVSHPDVVGVANRTRIKQQYRPSGPLVAPMFPPKWNLPAAGRLPNLLASRGEVGQCVLFEVQADGAAAPGM